MEKSIHDSSRRKYLGCGKNKYRTQVAESSQKKSIWILDIRRRYNKYSGYRIQKNSRRKVFGLWKVAKDIISTVKSSNFVRGP